MPRILTLEKIPRKKGWFTLILDNAYSFAVNDELIIKTALRPERELTKPEIEQIKSEGEYLFLRAKAFEYSISAAGF
jgi:hypothetical protein